MTQKSLKILVIRFSALGDLVLITPVLRVLKTQCKAEVHVITKDGFRELLTTNPHVDKVWTIGEGLGRVIRSLQAQHFDHIVDLHKNLRSWRIRLALWRIPATPYHKANLAKWLMVHFKINRLPNNHIVDRYLATVAPLGAMPDGKGLDFYLPVGKEVDVTKLGCQAEEYTAVVIGATHFTKRLPVDKLEEILFELPGRIVLIGGPAEKETGAKLEHTFPKRVISTCGQYDLMGSASLVRQAGVVVAHDTGFMHIAAALRKPVVAIFGGTLAEYGFWPYYGNETIASRRVEISGLSCRPCSRFGRADCPKGHFNCMRMITGKQVLQAWREIQEG